MAGPKKRKMPQAKDIAGAAAGMILIAVVVGEKRNFNLQPTVTEYVTWPFSTIEWVATEGKYRARAIVRHKSRNELVAFNSWHQDYADAERVIAALSDSLRGVGDRQIYNVFGEIIDIHTADIGAPTLATVLEVAALIWSMDERAPV